MPHAAVAAACPSGALRGGQGSYPLDHHHHLMTHPPHCVSDECDRSQFECDRSCSVAYAGDRFAAVAAASAAAGNYS